ncbi:P-loop containing nucleoside triphosphate hydrolase protein [Cercophora newfieldiana]|uniref:P-loop containing nucleoside triphosphate hydrolase protein n=1 Tax=Cercophora newfieldiana TaxID=92897 RepID=A0AA40CJJ3_9PEZI|nr:P-loop containing nucleoside triphosphate hydrolase protein [Cercophora newfieldiana]
MESSAETFSETIGADTPRADETVMAMDHNMVVSQDRLLCNTIPTAANNCFFGRQDILDEIERILKPARTEGGLRSVGLSGLGGIGKTQVALQYAYSKLDELDMVLWIDATCSGSANRSFTSAVKQLFPYFQGKEEEAREAKWLLVLDGLEPHANLEKFWPAARNGAILVTTRDGLATTPPIDHIFGVRGFDVSTGAEFLLRMARERKRLPDEGKHAPQITQALGGLPLALSQMAAHINAANRSLAEFLPLYYDDLLRETMPGSSSLGYGHSVVGVWVWDLEGNLSTEARRNLGFMAYSLAPADHMTDWEKAEWAKYVPHIVAVAGTFNSA